MIAFKSVEMVMGEKRLFREFSLYIKAKERLVIMGASGLGKTTLLRLIAGFEAPASGEIVLDGVVVSRAKEIVIAPEKRGVGMVFQDLALWPHMSVGENIAFGLKMKGVAPKKRREKVGEMLELVGLEGYENRSVTMLSGGQMQRVALARSLVLSPKILLMDEPLSSLDEKLSVHLRAQIVRLQEALGFTLVYVTHNQAEAEAIATKRLLIEDVV